MVINSHSNRPVIPQMVLGLDSDQAMLLGPLDNRAVAVHDTLLPVMIIVTATVCVLLTATVVPVAVTLLQVLVVLLVLLVQLLAITSTFTYTIAAT